MDTGDTSESRSAERSRRRRSEESGDGYKVGRWIVGCLAAVAVACIVAGILWKGWDGARILASCASLAAGVGFVAIGLLELEWLERLIGFTDGIVSGVIGWFWARNSSTLSDSIWFGRSGASFAWVALGIPVYVWGCLLALDIV